jgi:hypothetical protein
LAAFGLAESSEAIAYYTKQSLAVVATAAARSSAIGVAFFEQPLDHLQKSRQGMAQGR